MPVWIQGLFFLSGFLVVLGLVGAFSAPPGFVESRLAQIAGQVAPKAARPGSSAVTRSALRRLFRTLSLGVLRSRLMRKSNPRARGRLVRAGFHAPEAAHIFLGARLASGLAFFVLYHVLSLLSGAPAGGAWLFSLLLGALGLLLPGLWLSRRARARKVAVHRSLPDFLDLLTICVEAGQGIDQALDRVSREILTSHPVLGRELHILGLESKTGKSRTEALQNLHERVPVEDLKSFSAMLLYAERYGVSIADSLRIFSDTLRTSRRQAAEEKAAKTSIQISVPLVLFIFPALMLIILGPAALQFLKGALGP